MSILCDKTIRRLAQTQNMIEPFSESCLTNVVSSGLTSAGYDLRLGTKALIFKNSFNEIVSPKRMKEDPAYQQRVFDQIERRTGETIIIPGHSYILGYSLEYLRIPRKIKGRCVGKSTYARCGIVINTTPAEPAWCGHLTIEIANTSPCPVELFVGEGIAQMEFEELDQEPEMDYAKKGGKYQNQKPEPVPARMKTEEKEFEMVSFCPSCDTETTHLMRPSGHERDSSGDYERCLACGWWKTGISDEWSPPLGDWK
jgi:dCTP deaminase